MIAPEQLNALIEDRRIALLSFDVFDTLITRPLPDPVRVFDYMARICPAAPKNFPGMRTLAEREARKHAPCGEATLAEIYAALALMDGYNKELCSTLMVLEKETELRICRPRPEGAALLNAAADWDIRVILISDMYLSKERVSRMLCKCGLGHFSELYISSEYRRSKASGDLYRHVRRLEEMSFSRMLHIGDHPISDVLIPRQLGMHAVYLPLREGTPLPVPNAAARIFPYGTRRRKLAVSVAGILPKKTHRKK